MKGQLFITSKSQKELLKKLKQSEFDLKYQIVSKKIGMPISTIWQSWHSICANNNIELGIFINGEEFTRVKVIKESRKKMYVQMSELKKEEQDEQN